MRSVFANGGQYGVNIFRTDDQVSCENEDELKWRHGNDSIHQTARVHPVSTY